MKMRHEGSTLDAIEAVALEGFSRNRSPARPILLVLSLCAIAAVTYLAIDQFQRASRADWSVAVLLPKPPEMADKSTEEMDAILADEDLNFTTAVLANAKRQWDAFQAAFSGFGDGNAVPHHAYFTFGPGLPAREQISDQLEALYQEGIRTFVITMSGAVAQVKPVFVEWAATKPKKERPVMIATVASAPDIADLEAGVLRFFIRLEEETSVLATYLDAVDHQDDVTLFYVNDSYGQAANRILRDRIPALTYDRRHAISPGQEEQEQIRRFVGGYLLNETQNEPHSVVMIVGYGTMISNMIEQLQDPDLNGTGETFNGTMLIASTFTEEEWRPDLNGFADRIRTVGLVSEETSEDTAVELRGVVYQFSYLTLMRALGCRDERGVEAFWKCWKESRGQSTFGEEVELTDDGDSIVTSLRLLRVTS